MYKWIISVIFFIIVSCGSNPEEIKKEISENFDEYIYYVNNKEFQELNQFLPSDLYTEEEKSAHIEYYHRYVNSEETKDYIIRDDYTIDTLVNHEGEMFTRIHYVTEIIGDLTPHSQHKKGYPTVEEEFENAKNFWGGNQVFIDFDKKELTILFERNIYGRQSSSTQWEFFEWNDVTYPIIPPSVRES